MRVAKSSYRAWDSRGSWPKRPKAHGAAVEVGNREKEGVTEAMLEREEDIYDSSCCCTGRLGCLFPLASVCMDGWGCREKNASLARDTHPRVLISVPPHLERAATFDASGTTDYNRLGRSFVPYQEWSRSLMRSRALVPCTIRMPVPAVPTPVLYFLLSCFLNSYGHRRGLQNKTRR